MTTLQQGLDKINEAFKEDFIEKFKTLMTLTNELESRYCICGDNRNLHTNGEGGSPSPCEIEDCMCADYHYSLVYSLFADRNKFLEFEKDATKYPLLPLLIVVQSCGFDSEFLEFMSDTFLWNGDPATKPKNQPNGD